MLKLLGTARVHTDVLQQQENQHQANGVSIQFIPPPPSPLPLFISPLDNSIHFAYTDVLFERLELLFS